MSTTQTKKNNITDAEWEIMRVLWAQAPLESRQIIDRILALHPWKEATVKTLIQRLVDKEALAKNTLVSPYQYTPLVDQIQVSNEKLDQVFQKNCTKDAGALIQHSLDIATLSQADCQRLIQVLETKAQTAPDQVACQCPPGQCHCHLHSHHA